MIRLFAAAVALVLVVEGASAATRSVRGEHYLIRSFFTSALEDNLPVDRVDIVAPGSQVVMYTTYAELTDQEHAHVGRLYDAYGTLVHTFEHVFEPCGGKQRAWQWYQPPEDAPSGMWRFEVWLDGERVLENQIFVGVSGSDLSER